MDPLFSSLLAPAASAPGLSGYGGGEEKKDKGKGVRHLFLLCTGMPISLFYLEFRNGDPKTHLHK